MNREDFPIINENFIYFDNGATTLKPNVMVQSIEDYYTKYTANAHRGDYDNSLKVDTMYENTRKELQELINARSDKEIIFTSGATDSINRVVTGYFKDKLKETDEVLITKSEHASNVLPWFELGVNVSYIPLNENLEIDLDSVKKTITDKTKVISIAHITNVVGDVRPVKEIIEYAHSKNILVHIDGAQSVPHMVVDVQSLDVDFLSFSAHKMCGPTGVGVLYGKLELLNNMRPLLFGGGMNSLFNSDGVRIYHESPSLFEAGTPNIAGVIGYGASIKYLKNIGLNKIHEYECELKRYAVSKLEEIPDIIIYNKYSKSGIISFNHKNIFSQDLAVYLNKYKIAVRSGNHCAKILKDEIGIKNTCRASFYFYNTFEEIDKMIAALKNPNIMNELF